MDIVEWLRAQQTLFANSGSDDRRPGRAADEIDRLRSALAAEREACAKIARRVSSDLGESAVGEAIAKAILQRKE